MSRPRLGLFSLRAVIFQGGLHQCPSEKGAKASRLLARTSRSLVTSRLTLPANAGLLRLLPPKTPVRETRRWRRQSGANSSLGSQIPLLAGKIQGISSTLASVAESIVRIASIINRLR